MFQALSELGAGEPGGQGRSWKPNSVVEDKFSLGCQVGLLPVEDELFLKKFLFYIGV